MKKINNNNIFLEKKCKVDSDWGYLDSNNTWQLTSMFKKLYGGIVCLYREILFKDDFKYILGQKWKALVDGQTQILDEVFEVKCYSSNPQKFYNNVFVNFFNKFKRLNEKKKKKNS